LIKKPEKQANRATFTWFAPQKAIPKEARTIAVSDLLDAMA